MPLARNSSQVSAAFFFACTCGVIEEELDAVQRLFVQHLHSRECYCSRSNFLGTRDRRQLDLLGDVHVDAAIVVLAKLLLQRSDELPERLALVSHDVRQQQAVQQAVAFRKVLRDADAARLLATDENRLREHQVDDVLEADAVLDAICGHAWRRCGRASSSC